MPSKIDKSLDHPEIVKRLNFLRELELLTKEEFCKKSGISQSLLYQMNAGSTLVSDKTIIGIAKAFSVNLNWLKYGEGGIYSDKAKEEARTLISKDEAARRAAEDVLRMFYELPEDKQEFLTELLHNLVEMEKKRQGIS